MTTKKNVKENVCDLVNGAIPVKLESMGGMYRYHLHLDNAATSEYFIALDKVRYIDFSYDDEDYTINFQFETDDNYLLIYFDNESEFNYWTDYLRKILNNRKFL